MLGRSLSLTFALAAAFGLGAVLSPLGTVRAKEGDDVPAKALFAPGGEIENGLCDAIKRAEKEIVVAMFNFTSKALAEALGRAQARGVSVRIVLDKNESRQKYGKINDLRRMKVPVKLMALGKTGDDQQIRFHHKFMIIDREVVCTGSFNWTVQADDSNWENEVLIGSKPLAAEFLGQFEKAWAAAEDEEPAAPPKGGKR